MSDFFTRLAERTLGLAPTIQPIMPSLFEPESDSPGDMLLEITEEREGSVVADNLSRNTETSMLAQDGATSLTYPTQLIHAASIPGQHAVPQPFATTAPATVQRQSRSALASTIERQARRQSDSLTTYRETLATGVKVQPTQRGSQRTETIMPATSTYRQTPSIAPMNAQTLPARSVTDDLFTHDAHISLVQVASEQQLAEAQRTTRAAMPNEQSVSHHTLVGVPIANLPSTTGFLQAQQTQQTQSAQLETMSPEPAIQVTIGRIEVRAVTAPPTSARTQQQSDRPPAMSLDEYLHQQERGGRR